MSRLRDLRVVFFDAFVRENRVLPPVLALLALFLFAWVVAGAFVDGPDDRTTGEADLVQSREPSGDTPVSPEGENRDADSYAAYRNKDPFRQLLAPAETTSEGTSGGEDQDTSQEDDDTPGETPAGGNSPDGDPADGTSPPGSGAPGDATTGDGGDGTGGGQRTRNDSDGDGLTNRREERLGLDPRNPDTDDDGTQDGADDSNNDGVPDGRRNGNAGGGGAGTGAGAGGAGGGESGAGGNGGGNRGGRDDELFDSGGGFYPR